VPARSTIYRTSKVQNIWHIRNRKQHNSGRSRTGHSDRNIQNVRNALQSGNRGLLYLIIAGTLLVCHRPHLCRIVLLDLYWYPYQIHAWHTFLPGDYQRRLNYSRWLVGQVAAFLDNVMIGDEASFSMNGQVNTRNVREYAPRVFADG